jgi:hypothetical protein
LFELVCVHVATAAAIEMGKPKIPDKIRQIEVGLTRARPLSPVVPRLRELGQVVHDCVERLVAMQLIGHLCPLFCRPLQAGVDQAPGSTKTPLESTVRATPTLKALPRGRTMARAAAAPERLNAHRRPHRAAARAVRIPASGICNCAAARSWSSPTYPIRRSRARGCIV